MQLCVTRWLGVCRINVDQYRNNWRVFVHTVANFGSHVMSGISLLAGKADEPAALR